MVHNLIDIHTHILPGLDDGLQDPVQARQIVGQLSSAGIETICLTPHVNRFAGRFISGQDLERQFHNFVSSFEVLPCHLVLGAEIYYAPDLLSLIEHNPEWMFNREKGTFLLEFDPRVRPIGLEKVMLDVLMRGFKPVIAHIERYIWMEQSFLDFFANNSVLMQINSGSLLGYAGRKVKKKVERLIAHGWCQIIASDLHAPKDTCITLDKAAVWLSKLVGWSHARTLLVENPEKIV
jgi:protein-tyrosine phosphatase